LYLVIGKMMGKKVITFFHGWDNLYVQKLRNSIIFKRVYNQSSLIYVLCSQFKTDLYNSGITAPISLTTTKVDDRMLESFNINSRSGEIENVLFLARVERTKGIFIALDAIRKVQEQFPDLALTVVGNGEALIEAKEY